MIDLLLPIWLSGIMLAIISGPIGSFLVWRKMSYFGDTLAHSSLLGISCGLFLDINPFYTMVIIMLFLSILLLILEKISYLNTDVLLGILSHSSFSCGLIIISFMSDIRVDLMNYLFGDLLSINFSDIKIIFLLDIIVLMFIFLNWNKILLITINIEMAQVYGINVKKIKLILVILTALVISISIKLVGALLITSMMIIPAATARRFSSSPEKMILFSIFFGSLSVTGGIFLSFFYDTPIGPSIVFISSILFLISIIKKSN